ncbi:unnamed protein product [Nezara viridula]|uniref:Uncharacterized protein n=1 Tax=Nezara viridula TaxID=85310 RepID=A0A9P0EE03_NEZVI|nr:unnamed protein product [Nezara viridula]
MHLSLLGLVVLLSAHFALSSNHDEIKKACYKETGFESDIEKLNLNDPAIPNAAKCTLACGLEKHGVVRIITTYYFRLINIISL